MPRPGTIDVVNDCAGFVLQTDLPLTKQVGYGQPANLSVTAQGATRFEWYQGNSTTPIAGETDSLLDQQVTANTTFWVRAFRDSCSVDSRVATVTVCSTDATITAPSSVNIGRTGTATAAATSGTYAWTIEGGTITSAANLRQITFVPACSGSTVTLHVTVTEECTASNSKSVAVVTPTVTLAATSPIDQGNSSTLTAAISEAGPWTIGWSDGAASQQIVGGSASRTVSPARTTSYMIDSVNGCGGSYATATVVVIPPAPTTLSAHAISSGAIQLSWTVPGWATIDEYRIERCASNCGSGGAVWAFAGSSGVQSFTDVAVIADRSYVYRVRSITSGDLSGESPRDIATTIVFEDDPLVAGETTVRARHLEQLRIAANALRAAAGLGAIAWTEPATASRIITAADVLEVQSALNAARVQLGLATVVLTPPAPAVEGTIRAVHWNELRGGVR
ncbi:MAG TPA: fibronectin type III domain-containing protein [Thermoanaerobaculia bacterium]|nr:fibronectin type III domain-containing protein [Thermoanaerobaculia bacterium]